MAPLAIGTVWRSSAKSASALVVPASRVTAGAALSAPSPDARQSGCSTRGGASQVSPEA